MVLLAIAYDLSNQLTNYRLSLLQTQMARARAPDGRGWMCARCRCPIRLETWPVAQPVFEHIYSDSFAFHVNCRTRAHDEEADSAVADVGPAAA